MVAQKGALMLIKIGDGAETETFTTLGGLRASTVTLNRAVLDASCVGGGEWRQLAASAGLRSLRVEGLGLFTDAASEERARAVAFSGAAARFRLYSGNGDYVEGAFMIPLYARSGTHDAEELYALRLESADAILFVAGPA